jgi:hypothetical protein
MAISSAEASYMQLNSSAVADNVLGNVATFSNKTLATPPASFPPLKLEDFEVYLNNRRVPVSLVSSILQNGSDIDVTFDVASFLEIPSATLETDDEVLLIGKFN